MVYVAAYHSVQASGGSYSCGNRLETVDVGGGVADSGLEEACQRPVRMPPATAQPVEPRVQPNDQTMRAGTEQMKPAPASRGYVANITMHNQEASTIGSAMDTFVNHLNCTKHQPNVVPRELIVVPGHIEHPGTGLGLAKDLLHHVVMGLGPVPPAAQSPAVEHVPDQIQVLGIGRAEEV